MIENYYVGGLILGRIASFLAKKLILKKEINVYGIEKVIITGNKQDIQKKYFERFNLGTKRKGPFYKKSLEGIFIRAVKGMLSKNKKIIIKNLKVFQGNSKNFQFKLHFLKKSKVSEFIYLEEIHEKNTNN